MNNGFKNKRTKKNEDKLKWNYRKIIIGIKNIVKHNNNSRPNASPSPKSQGLRPLASLPKVYT